MPWPYSENIISFIYSIDIRRINKSIVFAIFHFHIGFWLPSSHSAIYSIFFNDISSSLLIVYKKHVFTYFCINNSHNIGEHWIVFFKPQHFLLYSLDFYIQNEANGFLLLVSLCQFFFYLWIELRFCLAITIFHNNTINNCNEMWNDS